MTNRTSSSNGQRKISSFVLAAIYITFILSFVAIAIGGFVIYSNEPQIAIEGGVVLVVIGFISMALAGYILLQSRKRVASLKIDLPPILTTIECRKCSIKTTRDFQRGDYVYKELEKCQKCEDNQVITAIYREVKEKEKPTNV